MPDKPFKTIDEQLEILRARGLAIPDESEARAYLLSYNYYRVVNGYKDMLLDFDKTSPGHEVYLEGASFTDLMKLHAFDCELRALVILSLLSVEVRIKTAVVYAFCERNQGTEDYLVSSKYCSESEYHYASGYGKNLEKLLSTLCAIRDGRPERPYTDHYRKHHEGVPLWVACNSMTFGCLSAFFDLQRRGVQNSACKYLCETSGKSRIKVEQLRQAISVLSSFRNVCAHGERLFCARAGRRNDRDFASMMSALALVQQADEQAGLENKVTELLSSFDYNPNLKKRVIKSMGLAST